MKYDIYIDSVVIFIWIWNTHLLWAVWRLLSCTATRKRIILAAFAGALVTGICIALPMGHLYMRLVVGALAAGFFMLRIGFTLIPMRNYLKVTGICAVCSFLEGSIFLRVATLWSGSGKWLVLWLISLFIQAGSLLAQKLQAKRNAQRLNRGSTVKSLIADPLIRVKITSGGKVLMADAIIDTGNNLWDPLYRQPVNLVSRKLAEQLEGAWCENSFHVVPYRSVGCQKGLLDAYRVSEIILQTRIEDRHCRLPVIAVADRGFDENYAYQMILHPLMLWKEDNSCYSMWQR